MLERPKRSLFSRKSLWITIIDFAIIFTILFFINSYLLSIKAIKFKDFKLKFKCDKLRNNIGYVFTFNILNKGDNEKEIKTDNNVKFFIQQKENKKIVWEKYIKKPTFPLNVLKNSLILKEDDFISYTYIYDFQNEPILTQDKWLFGVKLTIETNDFSLTIPVTTKSKKGFGKLLK